MRSTCILHPQKVSAARFKLNASKLRLAASACQLIPKIKDLKAEVKSESKKWHVLLPYCLLAIGQQTSAKLFRSHYQDIRDLYGFFAAAPPSYRRGVRAGVALLCGGFACSLFFFFSKRALEDEQ